MDRNFYYEHFIIWVLARLGDTPRIKDNGAIARLKRADSRELAPQAWDILFKHNIPEHHFTPCLLIGAALCRRGKASDGEASLGQALASCFEDKEQGGMRLRRLLACGNGEELCAVLRPMLSLFKAKATADICYARLLDELIRFDRAQESIKLGWARDFWNIQEQPEEPL